MRSIHVRFAFQKVLEKALAQSDSESSPGNAQAHTDPEAEVPGPSPRAPPLLTSGSLCSPKPGLLGPASPHDADFLEGVEFPFFGGCASFRPCGFLLLVKTIF